MGDSWRASSFVFNLAYKSMSITTRAHLANDAPLAKRTLLRVARSCFKIHGREINGWSSHKYESTNAGSFSRGDQQ
jgi:hypothetical protein